MGEVLGGKIGRVLKIDTDRNGHVRDSFIRVRVLLEISKPIRRGISVQLGKAAGKTWCELKYERLPLFCFHCGLIGHQWERCTVRNASMEKPAEGFGYGSSLVGETPNRFASPVVRFPGSRLKDKRKVGPHDGPPGRRPEKEDQFAEAREGQETSSRRDEKRPSEKSNPGTQPMSEDSASGSDASGVSRPPNPARMQKHGFNGREDGTPRSKTRPPKSGFASSCATTDPSVDAVSPNPEIMQSTMPPVSCTDTGFREHASRVKGDKRQMGPIVKEKQKAFEAQAHSFSAHSPKPKKRKNMPPPIPSISGTKPYLHAEPHPYIPGSPGPNSSHPGVTPSPFSRGPERYLLSKTKATSQLVDVNTPKVSADLGGTNKLTGEGCGVSKVRPRLGR
jgi:hypothetical protein